MFRCKLFIAIIMVIVMTAIATTYVQTYSTPGIYAVTIPMNYGVIASLWGAGGSGTGMIYPSSWYAGGSGAYVSCYVNAIPGSTIYLVVGQGGQFGGYAGTTSSAIGGGGNLQPGHYHDNNLKFYHDISYSLRYRSF